jgi:hypothetical protein
MIKTNVHMTIVAQ